MNKYGNLLRYLRSIPQSENAISLSFSEIEEIIHSALPQSAKKFRPWWANEKEGTHSQRLAWMDAGWLVDKVDLKNEIVTFRRD